MFNTKPVAVATQLRDYKNNIMWRYEMRLLSEASGKYWWRQWYFLFYFFYCDFSLLPPTAAPHHRRWYTVKLNVMLFFFFHFSTGCSFPQKTVPKLTLIRSILCSVASPMISLLLLAMFRTFFHTSICMMTSIEEHDKAWGRII